MDINYAFHLHYKCCMWIEFQSQPDFSPGTPVSSLLKIDSQSSPSGCGAVLRSHTRIVFRGRAPSRQHSSFGPTSLSCTLCNSVYGLRERVISRSIIQSPFQFCKATATIGFHIRSHNWQRLSEPIRNLEKKNIISLFDHHKQNCAIFLWLPLQEERTHHGAREENNALLVKHLLLVHS